MLILPPEKTDSDPTCNHQSNTRNLISGQNKSLLTYTDEWSDLHLFIMQAENICGTLIPSIVSAANKST